MKSEKNSIFGYKSEKSIKMYNRVLKWFLQFPLFVLILFIIVYPLYVSVLKNKPLPFNNPWLFMILYPILIAVSDFIATVVHELGHVFFGILAKKKFYSITFLAFTIEYSSKTKKFSYYHDNKRLIRDKLVAVGSAAMIPNNIKYSPFKDIIYYLGGAIFNLLAWFLLFIFHGNSVLSLMMLYSGISTLIPFRYASTTEGADGYYVISTLFSVEVRKIYEMQYESAKYLFSDIKLSSAEIFKVSEFLTNSPYLNNKFLAYFLLASFYIDNKDYAKATEHINKMKKMKGTLLNGETFWYDEDEVKRLEDKILCENHQLSRK